MWKGERQPSLLHSRLSRDPDAERARRVARGFWSTVGSSSFYNVSRTHHMMYMQMSASQHSAITSMLKTCLNLFHRSFVISANHLHFSGKITLLKNRNLKEFVCPYCTCPCVLCGICNLRVLICNLCNLCNL